MEQRDVTAALERLTREDAIGQLRRRDGAMARLGSEGDALKLDWVEAVPWLLARPDALAAVAAEAQALLASGARHIIWAGMGGSVLTVRVLQALGYCDGPPTIYPLDSTDPAALNAIVRRLATTKGIALAPDGEGADSLAQPDLLRALLDDVALVAVAMGMTSEEPITHLAWMSEALAAAGLPLGDHLRAMSLPGGYLGAWAEAHGVPRLALQLDGGSGTGGRMSAPGTRVFLLPAALWAAGESHAQESAESTEGVLATALRRAWGSYDLEGAQRDPAGNRFVRLAATLSAASVGGAVQLVISAPGPWSAVRDWAEQLFEESLGKGGKGVVVFGVRDALPKDSAAASDAQGAVWLHITGDDKPESPALAMGAGMSFTVHEPFIASDDPQERLSGLVTLLLGLQLTTALYGYLQDIPFAGQPAVEDYKARARSLRDGAADPLPALTAANSVAQGRLSLLADERLLAEARARGAAGVAETLTYALARIPWAPPLDDGAALPYLDLTINGEASPAALARLEASLRALAVTSLRIPCKLRRAPAAYHSTEQSEMDGPPWLLSLRALALRHQPALLGDYSRRFLEAQAVATWQAMRGVGRSCLLLLYEGDSDEMVEALAQLLDHVRSAPDLRRWPHG